MKLKQTTNISVCFLCKVELQSYEQFKCTECRAHPLRNQKSHVLFNALRRASEQKTSVDAFTIKALQEVIDTKDHPSTKLYCYNNFVNYYVLAKWNNKFFLQQNGNTHSENGKRYVLSHDPFCISFY